MNDDKPINPEEPDRIKKANPDPVKQALSHPNGLSLSEMLNGEEEKELKKKITSGDEPDAGPIPVI